MSSTATELEFLRFFYGAAADAFGPADDDIYCMINEEFEQETGKKVPDGYSRGEDE